MSAPAASPRRGGSNTVNTITVANGTGSSGTYALSRPGFRHHFAKCRVDVLEHLDGTYAVIWKKRVIGRYDHNGQALGCNPGGQPPDPRGLSLWGPEKRSKMGKGKPSASPFRPDVPPALGSLPGVALSSGETSLG